MLPPCSVWCRVAETRRTCGALSLVHRQALSLYADVRVILETRAAAAAQFECPVCNDNHSIEDSFVLNTCGHCMCREGAAGWAKAKLDEGAIPSCLHRGCKKPWSQEDMLVLDEELLRR